MLTVLISGKLVGADPETRTGKNGKPFTTAKVAVMQDDGERVLVSVIAFDAGERLARLRKGDDIACSGRASASAWLDKTTNEPKAGLRVVAEHILTAYELTGRRKPKADEA